MAGSREDLLRRRDPSTPSARTRGALGQRDAADPQMARSLAGDTPGPLGIADAAARIAAAFVAGTTGRLPRPLPHEPVPAWLPMVATWVPGLDSIVEILLRTLAGDGSPAPPGWVSVATEEVGVKEKAGKKRHHGRIVEYHATTTLQAQDDETPWCSSFVNWVMKETGYSGTGSALALSWSTWGDEIAKPALGSIGVIDWGKQDAKKKGKGHVGFVVGRTAKGSLVLLGGNQSDSVTRTAFARKFFVSFRVPKGFVVPPALYDLPELKLEAGGFRETR